MRKATTPSPRNHTTRIAALPPRLAAIVGDAMDAEMGGKIWQDAYIDAWIKPQPRLQIDPYHPYALSGLQRWARQQADRARHVWRTRDAAVVTVAPPVAVHASGLDRIDASPQDIRAAAMRMAAACKRNPAQAVAQYDIKGHTMQSRIARALCPRYWRRRLRSEYRQHREITWINLAPKAVNRVSPTGTTEYIAQCQVDDDFAASHVIRANDGTVYKIPNVAKRGEHIRAEQTARIKGLVTLGDAQGYTPVLITLTAPSRFHPLTTSSGERRENPRYDGSTPAQAYDWLMTRWTKLLRWARGGKRQRRHAMMGMAAPEPHTDGTPHIHVMAYIDPDSITSIRDKLIEIFVQKSEREPGDNRRVDFKVVGNDAQKAAWYMACYIDGSLTDINAPESEDKEATKYAAWRRIWRMHRVRWFDTSRKASERGSITAWRQIRRPDHAAMAEIAPEAYAAAVSGNWAAWYTAGREVGLCYTTATSAYGDPTRRLAGLIHKTTGEVSIPSRSWKIVRETQAAQAGKARHADASNDAPVLFIKDQDIAPAPTQSTTHPPADSVGDPQGGVRAGGGKGWNERSDAPGAIDSGGIRVTVRSMDLARPSMAVLVRRRKESAADYCVTYRIVSYRIVRDDRLGGGWQRHGEGLGGVAEAWRRLGDL